MVAPVGYSDISLSFSPEAFYTGIPGADVSRGMLYGQGKAEKLHADTRLQMELTEKERQFNQTIGEKIREYDESMEFGREQFSFFKDQYADQYGLQKDYLALQRAEAGRSSGTGFDMNAFLERMEFGKGPSLTPFDLGDRSGVTRVGATPQQQEDYQAKTSGSYYNPYSDRNIGEFLGGIEEGYGNLEDLY